MTDEELNELAKLECKKLLESEKGYGGLSSQEFWIEGVKYGLAAGKMRWHDLRKDPNDLPTLDGMYWTYNECGYYDIHIWIPQLWKECKVISWCELPKFEE